MTDTAPQVPHRFTVGGALGFGFQVLGARPRSVLVLLTAQTLIYVATTLSQLMLLGYMARQGIQAAEMGDSAGAYVQSMHLSTSSTLLSLLGLPFWIWLEAVWLTLFMTGRFTLWPGWAGMGRLALSMLILFGVYLGALFAIVFVVMLGVVFAALAAESGTGDSSVAVALLVLGLALVAFTGMIAALSVFSGLPAHALSGRLDIGAAIRTGWRHAGGLTLAWILFVLLYLLVMIIGYGGIALWVGDHVGMVFEDAFRDPTDPLLSMRLYAEVAPGPDKLGSSALVLTPILFFTGLVMIIGRGISAKLALSMPVPAEKAD